MKGRGCRILCCLTLCLITANTPAFGFLFRSVEDSCNKNEFKCRANSYCISRSWLCDGDNDCPDGEDEMNCPRSGCKIPNAFHCTSNGQCIPQRWVCDSELDCLDGSDEKKCSGITAGSSVSCSNDDKKCVTTAVCESNTCKTKVGETCPGTSFTFCQSGSQCVNTGSNYLCQGQTSSNNNNDSSNNKDNSGDGSESTMKLVAIAGGATGGVVAFITLVIVIVIICKRICNCLRAKPSSRENEDHTYIGLNTYPQATPPVEVTTQHGRATTGQNIFGNDPTRKMQHSSAEGQNKNTAVNCQRLSSDSLYEIVY